MADVNTIVGDAVETLRRECNYWSPASASVLPLVVGIIVGVGRTGWDDLPSPGAVGPVYSEAFLVVAMTR